VVVQERLLTILVPLLQLHDLLLEPFDLTNIIHNEQLEQLLQFVIACINLQPRGLLRNESAVELPNKPLSDPDDPSY
jgi:hypothetical protein